MVPKVWFTRGALRQVVPWLTCILLVVAPRPSYADFAAICEANPFKGSVKTVVLLEAPADFDSGRPRREPLVRYVTDITDDGRTATQVETFMEVPSPAERAKRPTKITQHDAAGRMISQVLNIDGLTTSCEYDDQGRLARATVTGRSRIANRSYDYTYGPSSRSELAVFAAASILTTVTLDEKARPVTEVAERRYVEFKRVDRWTTEYRYLPEGTEACLRPSDAPRWCRLSIYDGHGNMIEQRSDRGSTRVAYEYDAVGNWTKRITSSAGLPTYGVWRKITYW